MAKKIASARIAQSSSQLLQELNQSLPFDKLLYVEDIEGSIVHSAMLAKQGIISENEKEEIHQALRQVKEEVENGSFSLEGDDEDIHMAVERRVTEIVGDSGKRMHTARSRNDQVALDFRWYVQKHTLNLANLVKKNIETLITIAEKHTETLLPGMTHLQHAQPINFGYHMLAYVSMFKRDYERFMDAYERNNYSPIGCAALAGTPHPIDREFTSAELGFKAPSLNCLDTVSDRDFALDLLYNISVLMMHISRFSEELILWSSSEFKFITLSDAHATGSSIMPQKKNPDIPELLRGKSGRAYGNLIGLLTVMKSLPLAYNKDTQEDKEGAFDSITTATLSLRVLDEMMEAMTVNEENMAKACMIGHLSATDLADYLVKKVGIPFRDAYHITGDVVNLAETKGLDISELSLEDLQSIDARIDEDVIALLDNRASMNARNSQGGTASEQTIKQIEVIKGWLNSLIVSKRFNLTKEEFTYQTSLILIEHFTNCIQHDSKGFNTRIFSHILHPAHEFVAIGNSKEVVEGANPYPEHVVPCATLINESVRLIKEGKDKEYIARLLTKHWKIVYISKEQANYLDTKKGLNLQYKMPEGWNFETGDTYARLKLANIEVFPF